MLGHPLQVIEYFSSNLHFWETRPITQHPRKHTNYSWFSAIHILSDTNIICDFVKYLGILITTMMLLLQHSYATTRIPICPVGKWIVVKNYHSFDIGCHRNFITLPVYGIFELIWNEGYHYVRNLLSNTFLRAVVSYLRISSPIM